MIFSALKKLLTNNGRFKPDDVEYRRIIMLNIVLVLFIDFCVFYAIFNFSNGKILVTIFDMAAAVLGLAILTFYHKTDNVKAVSYAPHRRSFYPAYTYLHVKRTAKLHIYMDMRFSASHFFPVGQKRGVYLHRVYFSGPACVFRNQASAVGHIRIRL